MKPGGARRSESEFVSERKKLERSDFCPREEMTPRRAETIALVPSPEPARDGRRDRASATSAARLARARRRRHGRGPRARRRDSRARVGSDKLYPTRTDRDCRAPVPVVTFCVSRGRTGGVGGGTPDVGGVAIRGQGGLRGERDTGGLRLGEESKVERSARVSKRVPIARRESARVAVALRRVCFSRDNDVGRRPHACARRLSGEFDARVRREMPL